MPLEPHLWVIAVFVLLIGAASYGVYSLVEGEHPQSAAEPPASSASNQEVAPRDHSPPVEEDDSQVVSDEMQPAPSGPSEAGPSSLQKEPEPFVESVRGQPLISEEESLPAIEVEPAPPTPHAADTKQPPVLPPAPVEIETLGSDTNQDSIPEPQQAQSRPENVPEPTTPVIQNEPVTEEIPQDAGSNQAFHLQEIDRSAPSVKRFMLSREIMDKEPVGTVNSITVDDKGVTVVYAFSEIADMRERTIYYYWLY